MVRAHVLLALALALAACPSAVRRGPRDLDTVRPGPRVSHSRGVEGGVVLLWPRVYPSEDTAALRPQAAALQARLLALARGSFPDRPVDVRPEPERVCPLEGCLGAAVGVLLVRVEGGCAAVLQVSAPGTSPARQMPWAGIMSVSLEVPFREPPESYVQVVDFVPCGDLVETSREREAHVVLALQDVL